MPVLPSAPTECWASRAASGPTRTTEGQTKAGVLRPERALRRGLPNVASANSMRVAKGLPVLLKVLPYLAAMLIAIRTLRDSGLIDRLTELLAPACGAVGMDAELLPLLLLRPFSGSAAMAALADLFESHGPDSGVGYTASVLMGSSETIFYEVALYFGAVGVRRTRFAVPVSLAAMAAGVLTALLLCR